MFRFNIRYHKKTDNLSTEVGNFITLSFLLFYIYRVPDNVLMSINSPTMSLAVVDGNKTVNGQLKSDVVLKFKQLEVHNHSSPQCVYYKFSLHK